MDTNTPSAPDSTPAATGLSLYLRAYFVTFVVFMGIDAVWLTQMASRLYQPTIGHLLAPQPDLLAALVFYLLYILGMVVFTVRPAQRDASLKSAAGRGALFGLVAYATYDLTNQATLINWPWFVTFIDLIWGTFLTGTATLLAKAWLQRRA
jgi:uncharacterized membrane protein